MHRKSAENYFVLNDNIMYKKYARKKNNLWKLTQ